MQELNSEEMTSVRGGFLNNAVSIIKAFDNTAEAVNVIKGTANKSGGIGSVTQAGEAAAGNITATVVQAAS